jgi:hypothetical protein
MVLPSWCTVMLKYTYIWGHSMRKLQALCIALAITGCTNHDEERTILRQDMNSITLQCKQIHPHHRKRRSHFIGYIDCLYNGRIAYFAEHPDKDTDAYNDDILRKKSYVNALEHGQITLSDAVQSAEDSSLVLDQTLIGDKQSDENAPNLLKRIDTSIRHVTH